MIVLVITVILFLLSLLLFSNEYLLHFELNFLIYLHIVLCAQSLMKSVYNASRDSANTAHRENSSTNSSFFKINKFVLEHSHTHSLIHLHSLWLLLNNGRIEQLGRETMQLTESNILNCGPYTEKVQQLLLTSVQEYVNMRNIKMDPTWVIRSTYDNPKLDGVSTHLEKGIAKNVKQVKFENFAAKTLK